MPEDYVRKQTMKNAERYTTDTLKEREREILHAEEKSIAREEELFNGLIANDPRICRLLEGNRGRAGRDRRVHRLGRARPRVGLLQARAG